MGKALFDACIGRGVCAVSYANDYLYHYLISLEKHWTKLSKGSTFDSVNSLDIKELPIPLPPLPEQKAIAKVLSDVDELITSIEELIDKKQKIKQGTMQLLLTGKKRLPGFTGEWEVKRLGDIADTATGSTPSTKETSNYGNEYLFVSPADLGRNKYVWQTEKKLSKKGFNISREFPKNSILFTCIGSTIGKVGIAPTNLTSNQQINAIFPNNGHSTDFVYYCLFYLSPRIKKMASEQAVPIINKSTFETIQILLPPLPEQKAIAQILSDMDLEIEALEAKLEKYKHIKEGMMEQLLTGKVRLI